MSRDSATPPLPEPPPDTIYVLLEEAFGRYQDELLGTLYYLVGNREDAQEAYQQSFIRCWRHRETVPRVSNLRAWIFRVALNVGRDLRASGWRRRRKPLPEDESVLVVRRHDQAEGEVSRREKLALLRRQLLVLRSEEQEVFLLHENAGMTYDEIARILEVPLDTVKTWMRLAVTKLPQALSKP
ncbi:MAG: RNA polymerase sigma factor [Thermoguttaceae bacterium]